MIVENRTGSQDKSRGARSKTGRRTIGTVAAAALTLTSFMAFSAADRVQATAARRRPPAASP